MQRNLGVAAYNVAGTTPTLAARALRRRAGAAPRRLPAALRGGPARRAPRRRRRRPAGRARVADRPRRRAGRPLRGAGPTADRASVGPTTRSPCSRLAQLPTLGGRRGPGARGLGRRLPRRGPAALAEGDAGRGRSVRRGRPRATRDLGEARHPLATTAELHLALGDASPLGRRRGAARAAWSGPPGRPATSRGWRPRPSPSAARPPSVPSRVSARTVQRGRAAADFDGLRRRTRAHAR